MGNNLIMKEDLLQNKEGDRIIVNTKARRQFNCTTLFLIIDIISFIITLFFAIFFVKTLFIIFLCLTIIFSLALIISICLDKKKMRKKRKKLN